MKKLLFLLMFFPFITFSQNVKFDEIVKIKSTNDAEEYLTKVGFINIPSEDLSSSMIKYAWKPVFRNSKWIASAWVYIFKIQNKWILSFDFYDIIGLRNMNNNSFDLIIDEIHKNLQFKETMNFEGKRYKIYKIDEKSEMEYSTNYEFDKINMNIQLNRYD